jgi:ubiquinone/menaquinone biosynthesis C-methylase UbiE
MDINPLGAGNSSLDLIDSTRLFAEIGLKKGHIFLDLGCGAGNYSLKASEYVGSNGVIYAVDAWKDGIEALRKTAAAGGIGNIRPILADVSRDIPLEKDSVDMCLMATVLHDLVRADTHETALKEVRRILKNDGKLAIVEFKKIDGPPGPPKKIRISSEEVADMLISNDFHQTMTTEIGPQNYLSLFSRFPM